MFELTNDQQPQTNQKKGDPLWALYWLAVIHSNCIVPFLRTGFGKEALGIRGLLAFGMLLLCAAGEPLMGWWMLAFLVAIVVQRIITYRAISKGALIHTLYAGTPLVTKLPFVKEKQAVVLEMLLCFILGALFLGVCQFMGLFLMAGMLSLGMRMGIEDFIYTRRIDRMRDAKIEGRWYGDQMR